LSGGEKVRLKLFCLMQDEVNFLILDEPTNHIDITTREILEDTLNSYDGTILFVSHDRYFINKVATKVIEINSHKLNEYVGNYDDYKNYLSMR
jgi:ATP-binding cassette subfamily F protein 3